MDSFNQRVPTCSSVCLAVLFQETAVNLLSQIVAMIEISLPTKKGSSKVNTVFSFLIHPNGEPNLMVLSYINM